MKHRVTILLDFDGTITKKDLAYETLRKFGKGDWESIDEEYKEGKISLLDCISRQYSMIYGKLETMQEYISNIVEFRLGLPEFIDFCKKGVYDIVIVSAGLDFVIEFCLKILQLDLEVIALKTGFENSHLTVDTSSVRSNGHLDFKSIKIREEKEKGNYTIMIGDGITDRQAATHADQIFAVKDSILNEFCESEKLNYSVFEDFREIMKSIDNM